MSGELANVGKILIYQNEKGDTKIDVYFEDDTIWMTQSAMCDLYQVAKSSISEHISHIFRDGELDPAGNWFGNSERFSWREPGRLPESATAIISI